MVVEDGGLEGLVVEQHLVLLARCSLGEGGGNVLKVVESVGGYLSEGCGIAVVLVDAPWCGGCNGWSLV